MAFSAPEVLWQKRVCWPRREATASRGGGGGASPWPPGHSPDPQAFSIGQDREGCTQGPLGTDQHDPGGKGWSEQVAGVSRRKFLPA